MSRGTQETTEGSGGIDLAVSRACDFQLEQFWSLSPSEPSLEAEFLLIRLAKRLLPMEGKLVTLPERPIS